MPVQIRSRSSTNPLTGPSPFTSEASDQNRTWLVGVYRGAAGEQRNAAQSLIGRHEHSNVPGLPQVESNGQLERIECSKAFRNSMLNEQVSGALEMALANWQRNPEPLLGHIRTEAPASNVQGRMIDLACSHFDRKNGLQLDNREMRNQ